MRRFILLLFAFRSITNPVAANTTYSQNEKNFTTVANTIQDVTYTIYDFSLPSDNPVVLAFAQSGIVPRDIPAAPTKPLNFYYGMYIKANYGNVIKRIHMLLYPSVSWQDEPGAWYTLIMFHPEIPFKNFTYRRWQPWIVGNIPGCGKIPVGSVLYEYKFSRMPITEGSMRHVILLYKQKNGKIAFESKDKHRYGKIPYFKLANFVFKYDLGNPEYGNFFYSRN